MKTNDKRTVLLSLLNGKREPLEQLKAAELIKSIPTVFILMPDGSIDVGESTAFSSRFITEEELNPILAKTANSKNIYILPDNGRSAEG